jgi:adenosine deaminase
MLPSTEKIEKSNFTSSILNNVNTSSLSNDRKFEILKSLPKYNSHCHLGGEIPITTLMKYASQQQIEALKNAMSEIASGKEYEKAFNIFPLINQIINTHEKLKEAASQTCQRFKLDNNQIVLMRTGLKILENKDYEDYLKSVLDGIQEASSENFHTFLMLSLKRSSSWDMAKLTVDLALKYRKKGVIGIDISDISTTGNIKTIIPELLRAKENGLKIAVHMGESTEEQDQMLIINSLEPDLIDHGVNLCEEAKEWIKNRNIPVTVCLTSAVATKMHTPNHFHPWIIEHLKSEHPIDLGTDDSTVFGNIFLTDEFFKLCSDFEFEKIVQIANKSFERSKEIFNIKNL